MVEVTSVRNMLFNNGFSKVFAVWVGYYLGTLEMDDYALKHVCVRHKVVVVNVDYR